MSSSRPGAHRFTPTSRTHRPVPRGRHRMLDRHRAGAHHLRVVSTAIMLLLSVAGHFLGQPRRSRARRI